MADNIIKIARKIMLAGIGLLNDAISNVKDSVDELVERGELRRKDSSDFIAEILERMKVERDELGEVIRDIMRDVFNTAGLITAHDLQ
ncbi:MAG: hypothetical protein AB1546_00540, partial [bacterium]